IVIPRKLPGRTLKRGANKRPRHADILWRNTSTDSTIVWLMSGFTTVTAGSLGGVAPVWEVQ
ncbi:MAG: hypothetical protein OEM93_19280, partial [Rhodospirillales bacterium]|nr:hypothetical protein [Rhodospirillales bacterium]